MWGLSRTKKNNWSLAGIKKITGNKESSGSGMRGHGLDQSGSR
jgi:hypothetical protein